MGRRIRYRVVVRINGKLYYAHTDHRRKHPYCGWFPLGSKHGLPDLFTQSEALEVVELYKDQKPQLSKLVMSLDPDEAKEEEEVD